MRTRRGGDTRGVPGAQSGNKPTLGPLGTIFCCRLPDKPFLTRTLVDTSLCFHGLVNAAACDAATPPGSRVPDGEPDIGRIERGYCVGQRAGVTPRDRIFGRVEQGTSSRPDSTSRPPFAAGEAESKDAGLKSVRQSPPWPGGWQLGQYHVLRLRTLMSWTSVEHRGQGSPGARGMVHGASAVGGSGHSASRAAA